ncbi:MAG: DUF2147 domain-containing protein [Hydrogenophaga sp.]|jgi:uncharacterized protein (DUF2147 family)|nr:DUF2147 domain-containing protein [Hydrogenophaga sp.]
MTRLPVAIAFSLASSVAMAQMTPEGLWRNVDDKTGEAKAEIRIAATASGALNGKVERALTQSSEPNCSLCTDDRKDKPKLGMEIIRGAKKSDGGAVWEGGKILDPENGKEYTLRMTPLEDGRKLQIRGYIGPFYRTQIWTRVE